MGSSVTKGSNEDSPPSQSKKIRIAEVTDENQDPNVAKSNYEDLPLKRLKEYERLLRKYENDDQLVISKIDTKPGGKSNQNFLSNVVRARVTGKKSDGIEYEQSFIRKTVEKKDHDLYIVETHMYQKLLPHLGNISPKLIYSNAGEIIFEDLGRRQFHTHDTRNFFDLDHCSAVVQTLASMHAKSVALKLHDQATFKELIEPMKDNVFSEGSKLLLSEHYEKAIVTALKDLELIQPRTEKVECAIEFLLEYRGKVVETMRELLSPKTGGDDYWVIAHGDTWKHNIMFNHDNEGKIVNIKLVDYQFSKYSSPSRDLSYFLYSSAQLSVMEEHTDRLVSEYENFFLHHLRLCGVSEPDLKKFLPGWLVPEFKRYALFGLFHAITATGGLYLDETQTTEVVNESNGVEEQIKTHKSLKEKTERILFIIDHFISNFWSDL